MFVKKIVYAEFGLSMMDWMRRPVYFDIRVSGLGRFGSSESNWIRGGGVEFAR